MKIDFCIQGKGIMVRDLTVSVDWNYPYIPRIGDTIDTSVIADCIDPLKFYDALNEKEKKDWNESIEGCAGDGCSREEAMKGAVELWLDEMTLDIEHVYWCMNAEGLYLFISMNPNM